MFWLPTIAPHIKVIEAVRLAGKGFLAFNPQTSFGTFPLELDEIIIFFLAYLSFSILSYILYGLHIWKQRDPAFLSDLLMKTSFTA